MKKQCLISFDNKIPEHQSMLNDLKTDDITSWKSLGFQSENPTTDFRAGGYYALKFLHYFSIKHPNV